MIKIDPSKTVDKRNLTSSPYLLRIIRYKLYQISLIVIIVLNAIYTIIVGILTEYELPRTQQEFDDSYAFKVYCFQFVNYYSTLFYIAFFKDPLSGYPCKFSSTWFQFFKLELDFGLVSKLISLISSKFWTNCRNLSVG